MNSVNTRALARRYAQAFININGHALTAHIREQMVQLREFLLIQNRILFFLTIPAIDMSVKVQGLCFLCQKFELPRFVEKSLVVLLMSGRISLLMLFLEYVAILYKKEHAISSFVISSSHPLSLDQREFLKQFLKKHLGHDIVDTYVIDKKLIAGIRMYSSTHIWEHSIDQQLRSVQQLLVR